MKFKYHFILSILLIITIPILQILSFWHFYGELYIYTVLDFYTFFISPFLFLMMIFLLYLGGIKLERDSRGFNKAYLFRIYVLVCIIDSILPIFILNALSFTEYYFIEPFIIISDFFWIFLLIVFALVFILVGISNRTQYGNYLISAAILTIISIITNRITVFIEGLDIQLVIQYSAFFTSAFILAGALGTTYILFFGIRVKNLYFVLNSLFGIISNFGIFVLTEYNILLIVYLPLILGMLISSKFFELGKRFKRGFRVFVTHAVDDFKRYRISELAQFLESQKEIGQVYYCELDLTGNIDQWMNKTVPRCHLLIFLSTEQSLNSNDCITELNVARKNDLHIIPILGIGLEWETLKKLEIDREFGSVYDPMEFERFCTEVYQHVLKYKEALTREMPEKKKKLH